MCVIFSILIKISLCTTASFLTGSQSSNESGSKSTPGRHVELQHLHEFGIRQFAILFVNLAIGVEVQHLFHVLFDTGVIDLDISRRGQSLQHHKAKT